METTETGPHVVCDAGPVIHQDRQIGFPVVDEHVRVGEEHRRSG